MESATSPKVGALSNFGSADLGSSPRANATRQRAAISRAAAKLTSRAAPRLSVTSFSVPRAPRLYRNIHILSVLVPLRRTRRYSPPPSECRPVSVIVETVRAESKLRPRPILPLSDWDFGSPTGSPTGSRLRVARGPLVSQLRADFQRFSNGGVLPRRNMSTASDGPRLRHNLLIFGAKKRRRQQQSLLANQVGWVEPHQQCPLPA